MAPVLAKRLKLPERQTLAESVTDSLRQAIYLGRFRPGERLPQAHIAAELGVSQAPVREALTNLEREGLVERTANQGAMITALSRADIEEIGVLRPVLEALAVRLAIIHATPEDLANLDENVRATAEAKTPEETARLDLRFHELLMLAARNRRLLACWRSLMSPIQLALLRLNWQQPHDIAATTAANHAELLALIRAKDETCAVAHMERAVNWLRDYLLADLAEREGARTLDRIEP
jgi:DNA-binding GntR family transcriptional regulator